MQREELLYLLLALGADTYLVRVASSINRPIHLSLSNSVSYFRTIKPLLGVC